MIVTVWINDPFSHVVVVSVIVIVTDCMNDSFSAVVVTVIVIVTDCMNDSFSAVVVTVFVIVTY